MKDLNGYLFNNKTIDLGEISGICDCCGKSIRYAVILKHYKTGEEIFVGRECSNKSGIYCNHCTSKINKVIKAPDSKYYCILCKKEL